MSLTGFRSIDCHESWPPEPAPVQVTQTESMPALGSPVTVAWKVTSLPARVAAMFVIAGAAARAAFCLFEL